MSGHHGAFGSTFSPTPASTQRGTHASRTSDCPHPFVESVRRTVTVLTTTVVAKVSRHQDNCTFFGVADTSMPGCSRVIATMELEPRDDPTLTSTHAPGGSTAADTLYRSAPDLRRVCAGHTSETGAHPQFPSFNHWKYSPQ